MDNKKPRLLLIGYSGVDSSLRSIGTAISKHSKNINKLRIISGEPFLSRHEKYAILEEKPKNISSTISSEINSFISGRPKECRELNKLLEISGLVNSIKLNLNAVQEFYLEVTGMEDYSNRVEGGIPLIHHYSLMSILFQCTEREERMQLLSAMEEALHKWKNVEKDEYSSVEFAVMRINRQFILNNIEFIPRYNSDFAAVSNLIGNLTIDTADIRWYFFYNSIKCAITESKNDELVVGVTDLYSVFKLQEKISRLEKKIGQIDKAFLVFGKNYSN